MGKSVWACPFFNVLSDFLFSLNEQITYIEQYDIHLALEEHQKALFCNNLFCAF